jgi:hypothetical protein
MAHSCLDLPSLAVIEAQPGQHRDAALKWSIFVAVSLLASLLNPYGVHALTFPFELMSQPVNVRIQCQIWIVIMALVAFALAFPVRMAPIRVVIVLALVTMTTMVMPNGPLFALIKPMLLAEPIANAVGQKRKVGRRRALRIAGGRS